MKKKIYVFDLDNTLWNGKQLYPDVRAILTHLHENGAILYIASHNKRADKRCEQLGISHFFKCIVFGREHSKVVMVRNIMQLHPQLQPSEFVFADDQFINALHVALYCSVPVVHVDEGIGLQWRDLLLC